MWTAVLGEHDRNVEEGYEQRLMVDKVILHERFKEYHNDIGELYNEFTQLLLVSRLYKMYFMLCRM